MGISHSIEHSIDYVIANTSGVDNDVITGKLPKGSVVIDGDQKGLVVKQLMQYVCSRESDLDNVYALSVGNGGNDMEMLSNAYPFGVAFNAKQVLRKNSLFHVNEYDLKLITIMIEACMSLKMTLDSTRARIMKVESKVNSIRTSASILS